MLPAPARRKLTPSGLLQALVAKRSHSFSNCRIFGAGFVILLNMSETDLFFAEVLPPRTESGTRISLLISSLMRRFANFAKDFERQGGYQTMQIPAPL